MYWAIQDFIWTSKMLSILGWIGHVLHHPDFYVDQLDVIYTGTDRSFIASFELLCGQVKCYLYWA